MTELTLAAPWAPVETGETAVAVAERDALGTTARVAVWPPENLGRALEAVDAVVASLDRQASRFRPDSEISRLHRRNGGMFMLSDGLADSEISRLHRRNGGMFMLSDGLAEAVGVALAAARWTRGMTDPTVGGALISLGYDRDFAAIDADGGRPLAAPAGVPGWRSVTLDGPVLRLPSGVRLDLGATAKGLGSDRAVRAAMSANRQEGGVLVSLGGDIAVDGQPPCDGWPILVADEPDPSGRASTQTVRLVAGAVATSSIACRQWRRGGQEVHHIVDPRTSLPAVAPWRTVSVAAVTCADANAASTAGVVAGERAEAWLTEARLPARLVSRDGEVHYLGGWPESDDQPLMVSSPGHVYGGAGPRW